MCGEYTYYTRKYHHPGAQFWVGSSRNWSVFLERPNTGRHEKAPVRCPCSRLAALHGDPRTHHDIVEVLIVFLLIKYSFFFHFFVFLSTANMLFGGILHEINILRTVIINITHFKKIITFLFFYCRTTFSYVYVFVTVWTLSYVHYCF